jgi:hypothetical protein
MRCTQVIFGSLLLVLVLGSFIHGQTRSVSIDAPREISLFQPPVIRVTGLVPLPPVAISVIKRELDTDARIAREPMRMNVLRAIGRARPANAMNRNNRWPTLTSKTLRVSSPRRRLFDSR